MILLHLALEHFILPTITFVSLSLAVLATVLVFRIAARAVASAERAHQRSNDYNADLLDRLMSVDYNQYRAYKTPEWETQKETGFIPADYPDEEPVENTRRGFGSRLGLAVDRGGDAA